MENEEESEPEHRLEEAVVGGFLVLALLSYHLHLLVYCTRREWRSPALGDVGS